jgi:hypothetical protein
MDNPEPARPHIEPPKDFDIEPYLIKSNAEIAHFTIIFIGDNKWVSSGTFVNYGGYYGILTAQHVAKELWKSSNVALSITEYPSRVKFDPKHCEHVMIGENVLESEDGPDLSFLIIRDTNLLGILKAHKSFYLLDNKDLSYFKDTPLDRMVLSIAGSPDEARQLIEMSPTDGPVMKLQNFVGLARLQTRTTRDGFDFLKVAVPFNEGNYPNAYGGMSGGGIWLVPFTVEGDDCSTIRYESPILVGVSYFESLPEGREKIITAHGYDSIYVNVRQILKNKNVTKN